MPRRLSSLALLALGSLAIAAEDPFASLHLEAHGFVSFGYLKTWGNNWLGESLDGTDEFWEAAGNVIARPMDRLRLGAQLITRDLGDSINGKVELDWAYVDWRASDELGVQVGRIKIPYGLYGESVDVDAARTTVFQSLIYGRREREIRLTTDGAKLYGRVDDLDWTLCAGQRQLQTDGDTATSFAATAGLAAVSDIHYDLLAAGMLHWHTPMEGLALRLTLNWLNGLEVEGPLALAPLTLTYVLPNTYAGVASLLYERGDWTWTLEYARQYAGNQSLTLTPPGGAPPIAQPTTTLNRDFACLSCTWQVRPWCELLLGFDGMWDDATDRHGKEFEETLIGAINLLPTSHWSLKAEYRMTRGVASVQPQLNPDGRDDHWQCLALKTTVDF
jgi:hypothetical protein